ncbi:MAG TPA: hypothetical protein DIC34_02245 [Treponema sp.]|nr:MAG: hypothetical protein A2001_09170 [Treponema sp. GWC1_61_84]HCM25364.1 hypothetical protein [Treponema sp.]
MPELLLIVLTILVSIVVVELFLVLRELAGLSARIPMSLEDAPSKGQTINVNVGAPAVAETKIPTPPGETVAVAEIPPPVPPIDPETLAAIEESKAADRKEEAPARMTERSATSMDLRPTASGLIAKKCPKCEMENSVYRSECFNCGERL